MFELMKLPFERDALEPIISKEIIDYHYGKHHQGYVDNLNKLIEGTTFENSTLEEIVQKSSAEKGLNHTMGHQVTLAPSIDNNAVFNNAAQVYNHNLYWESLRPENPVGGEITSAAEKRISRYYGSIDGLKQTIKQAATKHFGSGWVWVCQHEDESLFVRDTHDADTPVIDPLVTPLIVIDVWEHAYYLDYKNDRAAYIDAIWPIINWDKLT